MSSCQRKEYGCNEYLHPEIFTGTNEVGTRTRNKSEAATLQGCKIIRGRVLDGAWLQACVKKKKVKYLRRVQSGGSLEEVREIEEKTNIPFDID